MERVIAAEMTDYLLKNNVISKHQHGFLSRRSTATNLLECLSDWTLAIDGGQTTAAVYVTSLELLILSHVKNWFTNYRITESPGLLNFVSSFLSDRILSEPGSTMRYPKPPSWQVE
mgnify:CR=1 FL=1